MTPASTRRGGRGAVGATYLGDARCSFVVWAPAAREVEVVLDPDGQARAVPLAAAPRGYHAAEVDGAQAGTRYRLRLDGERELPDPASRSQPEGVHGPSEVIDPSSFAWSDEAWSGPPLPSYVIYELHVGTFTTEGTFDAVVPHLDRLAGLGVTAVELMPVAQFPGSRNWGYDGVYPYAAQSSYGGPSGLQRIVDACHARGLAVVLDVVYNHLGPEGNYLREFGPYFTGRYRTPWGDAINLDGPDSDEVRRYFVGNAVQWLEDFHVDALRLDAVHGIVDTSARPFLLELSEEVERVAARTGRRLHLVAESELSDPRLITPRAFGGLGMDGQWADDLHHAVHTLLTGERDGYYEDFGETEHLVRAIRDGYAYTGQYSPHRRRRHGAPTPGIPGHRFVVCVQNHDQVGNRMRGERLSELTDVEGLKLAAGAFLLSPYLPLLFMGEEYGETAPFQYFVSHSDPDLVAAVREGRKEEFAHFGWEEEPPDPQDEATFERSRLRPELAQRGHHRALCELYRELLRLRREVPALADLSRDRLEVRAEDRVVVLRRRTEDDEALVLLNFGPEAAVRLPGDGEGAWTKRVESSQERWAGPGGCVPDDVRPEAEVKVCERSFLLLTREHGPGGWPANTPEGSAS